MESEEDEDEDAEDSASGWETDHGSEDDEDVDFDESQVSGARCFQVICFIERLLQAIPITSCLFCPQTTSSMADAAEHMKFHHGFALPDRKYLTDEEGMLKYLGRSCRSALDWKGLNLLQVPSWQDSSTGPCRIEQ